MGGKSMRILLIVICLLLLAAVGAQAEVKETNDQVANAMVAQGALAQVLTLENPSLQPPPIQPKVANIKRSYVPNSDSLITKFLGGKQTLIGNGQSIVSPIWGKGTRYKSGTVIYAVPLDNKQRVRDINQFPKLESVPAFLDVYPSGFLYTNNISHKGVITTEIKVKGKDDSDISYKKLYDPKEGHAAVEQMLPGMVGELTLPKGFRKRYSEIVQNFGERLYAYHVEPEYVTTYSVIDKNGKVVGEKPIAIPVMDSYVHVLLDGDKVLAGMEYFWDSQLSLDGTPKPCIQFAEATTKAQSWLINRYKGTPPLYNVSNVKLGYVQDRTNRNLLVPAWIFDAWYDTPVPASVGTTENPVKRTNDPFAVNALTGKAFRLSNI
jgi:hypothetical protein